MIDACFISRRNFSSKIIFLCFFFVFSPLNKMHFLVKHEFLLHFVSLSLTQKSFFIFLLDALLEHDDDDVVWQWHRFEMNARVSVAPFTNEKRNFTIAQTLRLKLPKESWITLIECVHKMFGPKLFAKLRRSKINWPITSSLPYRTEWKTLYQLC